MWGVECANEEMHLTLIQVRERVKRRRESSIYYKWQSQLGAYDKGLLALPGIDEIPQ